MTIERNREYNCKLKTNDVRALNHVHEREGADTPAIELKRDQLG
jgi:hypothetical protein